MPTAPGPLLQDQQNLVTDGARLRAVDTADAYGAGVGRALERLGDQAFQVIGQFEQRADQRDVDEGDIEYQRRSREILYGRVPDPETPGDEGRRGFFDMEGEDAAANRVRIEEELSALRQEIRGRRRSQGAQRAFDNVSATRLENWLESADTHVMRQVRAAENQTREALATESLNGAIAAYMDVDEAAAQINTGVDVVLEQADAAGASPERTEQMIKDFQSRAWAGVILRRVDEDPIGARQIFNDRRALMNAEDVGRVMEATRAQFLAERARTEVERIRAVAGNDFRAAYAMADDIADTTLQDEVFARLARDAERGESSERADALNAAERVRTAWSQGQEVRAADRALLIREGMWNDMIRDNRMPGQGDPTNDFLTRMSVDDPRAFNLIMRVIRNQPMPEGVSERQMDALLRETTGLGVDGWRQRGRGLPSDDYVRLVNTHEYSQGNRSNTDEGTTLVQRAYADTWNVARARAGQLGVRLGDQVANRPRTDQLRSFIYSRVREHVQTYNEAPTDEQMSAIVNEAFLQRRSAGLFGMGEVQPRGAFAFQAQQSSRANGVQQNEQRVVVRLNDMPAQTARNLHRDYRAANNLGYVPYDQIPEQVQREYAQAWREMNPGVAVTAGSPGERAVREFVQQGWTDDPRRFGAFADRRDAVEQAYADELQGR